MKIHFSGYSLDIMGSLQKYNAGLTAFDAKKRISEYFVWEVDILVISAT